MNRLESLTGPRESDMAENPGPALHAVQGVMDNTQAVVSDQFFSPVWTHTMALLCSCCFPFLLALVASLDDTWVQTLVQSPGQEPVQICHKDTCGAKGFGHQAERKFVLRKSR